MSRLVRSTLVLVVVGVMVGTAAYSLRHRLVHLLTRTTGTWVGAPDG